MQCSNYPFASYFQGKIKLVGVRSATLSHRGFAASFASQEAADLTDDLPGIYSGITGSEHDPHGISGPGNKSNSPVV
jgi:hypothetical protein